ncbi:hypothetical protein [Flavobacterium sp.]|uniref:hypothetical protein n=1 Tax=Flavobacterium sp. TaxID=239 RepID=UPI0025FC9413|nr:hypothetical protein [Flavobacterium sp.]
MNTITNLTQIADCNALLAWAGKEKADLTFKKISDERLTVRYADTAQELDALLGGVIAELTATETIIAVLPDGPTKDDAINKKTRLEYKKFLLETRKESYGVIALVEKEMDLERVNREIEVVDTFIAAVEAQKVTLAA